MFYRVSMSLFSPLGFRDVDGDNKISKREWCGCSCSTRDSGYIEEADDDKKGEDGYGEIDIDEAFRYYLTRGDDIKIKQMNYLAELLAGYPSANSVEALDLLVTMAGYEGGLIYCARLEYALQNLMEKTFNKPDNNPEEEWNVTAGPEQYQFHRIARPISPGSVGSFLN
jgi:hypothetical protein